tara:strand:+ start:502 stop:1152 length:651 start_codon:yes stop_codon:yes gene_type:complete
MVKRNRVASIVTEHVTDAPPSQAKSKQAWRYPNNEIKRAVSITLGSHEYTDPKELPERLPRRHQESNFCVTINPNMKVGENQQMMASTAWYAALSAVNKDLMKRCIMLGPVHADPYAKDQIEEVIEQIDFMANTESGEKMHRTHAHIWITITHWSQIQLMAPMIGAVFKEAYNESLGKTHPLRITRKPYVNVKLLPQSNWVNVMKQYIQKGMLGPA